MAPAPRRPPPRHAERPLIDLVYDIDCPNVEATRLNLASALQSMGLASAWLEHRIGDREAPSRTRGFGSPTVLVEGRDVAGLEPAAEACCRVYAGGSGVPPVDLIADALARAKDGPR